MARVNVSVFIVVSYLPYTQRHVSLNCSRASTCFAVVCFANLCAVAFVYIVWLVFRIVNIFGGLEFGRLIRQRIGLLCTSFPHKQPNNICRICSPCRKRRFLVQICFFLCFMYNNQTKLFTLKRSLLETNVSVCLTLRLSPGPEHLLYSGFDRKRTLAKAFKIFHHFNQHIDTST